MFRTTILAKILSELKTIDFYTIKNLINLNVSLKFIVNVSKRRENSFNKVIILFKILLYLWQLFIQVMTVHYYYYC